MKDREMITGPIAADVSWNDIGGLAETKDHLKKTIVEAIKHLGLNDDHGEKLSAGILLIGPPGCGKKMLVNAVARETGAALHYATGTQIMDLYGHHGFQAVFDFFQEARNSSPFIIFLDEFDKMCPRISTLPSSKEGRIHRQAICLLLLELDRLEGGYVMASTRNPNAVEPAAIKDGRLDVFVHVGLPSADDRLDILRVWSGQDQHLCLAADVMLEDVANDVKCEGFSGADMEYLIRQACNLAGEEYKTVHRDHLSGPVLIHQRHFQGAFQTATRTIPTQVVRNYRSLQFRYMS